MEMVRERQMVETANELEAQQHNAQINERYRRLLSAEADQFASETPVREVRASVLAPEAPTYVTPVTEETPVLEQVPQVTEFVHERITASVFTPEKFDNIQDFAPVNSAAAEMVAPTFVAPVFEQAPVMEMAREVEYSLSPLAKLVMAGAAATAVVLLVFVMILNLLAGFIGNLIRKSTYGDAK